MVVIFDNTLKVDVQVNSDHGPETVAMLALAFFFGVGGFLMGCVATWLVLR